MKSGSLQVVAAIALMMAAGCATDQPSNWGFRYEDRDQIAGTAAKIESVSAGLQDLAIRPDSYLATKNMYMAGSYDTKAADTVRFFANAAARFHRAVIAWKPGGSIALDYSSLTRQWDGLQMASARLRSSEQMRVRIETLNALMMDLSRLITAVRSTGAMPAVPPANPAAQPAVSGPALRQ
jgi:hypothetical protein